jgi:hypothetical protein
VFGNRVPRRTFGPKREEVVGGWRSLHNEELYNFASPNVIKSDHMNEDDMGRSHGMHGRDTKCIQNFGEKT